MLATTTRQTERKINIKLPMMHAAQRTIKRGMGRFNVVDCGRRFGKDFLGQDRAIFFTSKAQPVGWGAPTYRMLTENYAMLSDTLSPIITRRLRNERLDIMGGGSIDFWSMDQPDRIRGHRYAHFIVNEAAMVPGLMDAWNLIIRPTLIDLGGSIDFMSTPRGLNDFFNLWQMALEMKGWERFHYTSYDNPFIPRAELDELAAVMPERVYQQEIMAEFLEDGSYFQKVREAATIQVPDMPEDHEGHYLVAGLDWAISNDYTVLTIACRNCNKVVDWDRFNQLDFTYQRRRIIDRLLQWDAGLLPERNSIGLPNIELLLTEVRVLFGHDGKPGFLTTAGTKPELIQGLASALEHHGFQVPAEYADELLSYQVETMTSGHLKFEAPPGQHDDRVISLALAWRAMGDATWLMA